MQVEPTDKTLELDKYLCVDVETDGKDPNTCNLVGVGIGSSNSTAYYTYPEDKELIEKIIYLPDIKFMIMHNMKFDYKVLKRHGINIKSKIYDTYLMSYVQNSEGYNGLKNLACSVLKKPRMTFEDLIGKGKNKKELKDIPVEDVAHYCKLDVANTEDLFLFYKEHSINWWLVELECELAKILADMELDGAKLDVNKLLELQTSISDRMKELERKIVSLTPEGFNFNSGKQLGTWLFETRGLNYTWKMSDNGQYKTDSKVLEAVKCDDETGVIEFILEWKKLKKLKTTYIESLLEKKDDKDILHCTFNQAITSTGRLSSSNPNLQNIPTKTDLGKELRKVFISRFDGGKLISADYSQIELRVLAHMSEDPVLVKAFIDGEDIHKKTASEVFKVPISEVTEEMRYKCKTLNFALLYQQGAFSTAQQLNISVPEAENLISNYFKALPNIQPFFEDIKSMTLKNGYIETLYGRRRYFYNLYSNVNKLVQEDLRAACNMPIQGTAADILKIAMVRLGTKFIGLKSKIILQIHDELVIDVHPDEASWLSTMVRRTMELEQPLNVPLIVNVGIGDSWYSAK